ncbi:MAG: hypothetical protein Q9217_005109 [Psora testacea]
MPDKPLTVFTYAASASLAAVAIVYFFHPNYLFDGDSSTGTASARKKGIVSLSNPANDCFINCILQSLAGLGDLRIYMIRELHRRELGGPAVYGSIPYRDANGRKIDARELLSLQKAEVTKGLKDMIDKLNERPIYKKTISAAGFIKVLERAFGTTISKAQQDAQELLQVVAERLSEEYQAGRDARKRSRGLGKDERGSEDSEAMVGSEKFGNVKEDPTPTFQAILGANREEPTMENIEVKEPMEEEDGFPLEGQTEARTECQYCHFTPKANPTSFVMLNLMVPQKSSSSLNDCFDAHFKMEYIEDYKCDNCRLTHAIGFLTRNLAKAKTEQATKSIEADIEKLQKAVNEDPEKVPEGVTLPDIKLAPKRTIARHIEITTFPKVLVIHLSRSIYDPRSSSMKNMARVAFPERFPVGGILKRRTYKLLCMVAHKGTHNSGHYETFRRQHSYGPYSNPYSDKTTGPYSAGATPNPSMKPSPNVRPTSKSPEPGDPELDLTTAAAERDVDSPESSSAPTSDSHSLSSTRPSSESEDVAGGPKGMVITESENPAGSNITSTELSLTKRHLAPATGAQQQSKTASVADLNRMKRRKKPVDRWWRISDDKVKECKMGDVLDMKKEVYMLFYEMEKDNEAG